MAWNNLKSREKNLLVIGLILVLVVGFYYWIYQPQINKLANIEKEIKQDKQDLKVKSTMLQKKERLEKKYQILLNELKERHKKFLTSEEKTRLIMDLSDMASEVNVNLISTNPGQVTEKNIYLQFPVKVKLEGKYNDIINFMKRIENLQYLVQIRNLNVSSDLVPADKVQVEIELVSYALAKSRGDQK